MIQNPARFVKKALATWSKSDGMTAARMMSAAVLRKLGSLHGIDLDAEADHLIQGGELNDYNMGDRELLWAHSPDAVHATRLPESQESDEPNKKRKASSAAESTKLAQRFRTEPSQEV
jgi:hypothetical protein